MTHSTVTPTLQASTWSFSGHTVLGRVWHALTRIRASRTPRPEDLERLLRARTEAEAARRRTDYLLMCR